jgi:putative peptidoglycan lipid II flippase
MSAAAAEAVRRPGSRRVFRAASAVMISTIVVKAVALVKEVVVAGAYGRSDELEAFLIAALIPGLLINLIAESTNQALIPTLVRIRKQKGKERAGQLFSSVTGWSLLLLIAASATAAIGARSIFPIVESHFTSAKLELSIDLFYGMLPVVAITGVASICTAVLNTEDVFAVPAVTPAITPLLTIVSVLMLTARCGVWAMVYAMVAAGVIHASLMLWKAGARGYRLFSRWSGWNQEIREVAGQFGLVALSSVVASGGLVVDQAMAASLPAGSIAALAYAGRFVGVVLALLGAAVSSVLTPRFSEMVAGAAWAQCGRMMRAWAWASGGVAAAASLAMITCSSTLIRMTLQHGMFGMRDSGAVSGVLVMYALQIPFFVASRVFYRFLVAVRRTEIILYCGIVNLVLDVCLNLLLMRWLGVAGIALATSMWAVSTFVFLWYWSRRVLAEVSCSDGDAPVSG